MTKACRDCGARLEKTDVWVGGDPQCRHWHRDYQPPDDLVVAIEHLREIFGRSEIYCAANAIVGGAL